MHLCTAGNYIQVANKITFNFVLGLVCVGADTVFNGGYVMEFPGRLQKNVLEAYAL